MLTSFRTASTSFSCAQLRRARYTRFLEIRPVNSAPSFYAHTRALGHQALVQSRGCDLARSSVLLASGTRALSTNVARGNTSTLDGAPLASGPKGDYYPNRSGEKVGPGGRFQLVTELCIDEDAGWAIWAALDSKAGRKVSLHVYSASRTRQTTERAFQREIHEKIERERVLVHRGMTDLKFDPTLRTHGIVSIVDNFTTPSEHGEHLCLVSAFVGPSLDQMYYYSVPEGETPLTALGLPHVKSIARQLLVGLDFLHECKIIHGNILLYNILVNVDETVKTFSSEGTQGNLVHLFKTEKEAPESRVRVSLSDFASASHLHNPRLGLKQPFLIRAPENAARCPYDSSIDIWNVGCIIYKHLAGYHPFSFQERSQLPDQEGVLQLFVIQQALGRKFDPAFYGRSHLMDKWINQSGDVALGFSTSGMSLADRLRKETKLSLEEIPGCLDLLSRMLSMNPNERDKASTLRDHPWLLA